MSDTGPSFPANSADDHSAYAPTSPSVPKPSESLSVGTQGDQPVLSMNGITCRFKDVIANKDVHFDLFRGEIHGLLGENGAGKTTLMSVLYGLYKPEAGEIFVKGKRVDIKSPLDAIGLGIAMVHQHFLLTPNHTVTENIIVGVKPRERTIFLRTADAEKKILELSKRYGLKIDPKAIVGNLSVGEQQRVEIIKALYRDIDILILDEPTSMLTPVEEKALFSTLSAMVKAGLSIIFITHKLQEVIEASTRVTVLRGGKVVGTVMTAQTTETELARLMIGRTLTRGTGLQQGEIHAGIEKSPNAKASAGHATVLEIKNVFALNNSAIQALKDLSLTVSKGEILGIAGVDGNGQSEMAEIVSGLRKVQSGQVVIDGRDITGMSPKQIREWGLAYIPEDRLNTGLILEYSIAENLILDRWYSRPYSGKIFLNKHEMKRFAEEIVTNFDVRTPSLDIQVRYLSGGNLQKIVLGRELSREHKLIIAHNPTRGLDVGAAEYVHKQLFKQRDSGVGVLLLSLDLDEILLVSDRIAVLYAGSIMGVFDRATADVDKIGPLMGGYVAEASN
ncbi:MAG: ABC transporter ATP-binding protein [Nitrososphaeraceae archaeon]